ncbi:MAG: ABC transporter permease subunit [Thermodesulfobacteriota bacterium]
MKEASLALGVPYYRTILKVILPAGFSGITTGILISVARIAGETAPLLFTAFGNPFMNVNIIKPVNALPLLIYNYATSPYPEWHSIAWGASCVLVGVVLVLNLVTRIMARRWKVQF